MKGSGVIENKKVLLLSLIKNEGRCYHTCYKDSDECCFFNQYYFMIQGVSKCGLKIEFRNPNTTIEEDFQIYVEHLKDMYIKEFGVDSLVEELL